MRKMQKRIAPWQSNKVLVLEAEDTFTLQIRLLSGEACSFEREKVIIMRDFINAWLEKKR